jgi:hypothetical protein
MRVVPYVAYPLPPPDPVLHRVAEVLDPVVIPLGFGAGQLGSADGRAQVIFCPGDHGRPEGACVDLVVDLEAAPDWRVVDVRFWGYTSDRWHLAFDTHGDLDAQLSGLARMLPDELA